MTSIFIKDDLRASVEAASGGKMTVLYTAKGQPSYMTRIPAFNLEDIDPSLGTGLHPAFKVGGIEKSEILVGTYQGIEKNGELLSLPGVDPTVSRNHDVFVSAARACGPGWHCITNAEWMAISLWSWKNGTLPTGNNDYGRDVVSKFETGTRVDGLLPGEATGAARTYTGSGPASWRHDNTPAGISDMNGNVWEWTPGLRIVDGEIQIIPDNDAALNSTDLSAGSSAWRAILASNGALVAPGTSGTLKYDSTTDTTASEPQSVGQPRLATSITNRNGTPGDNSNLAYTGVKFTDLALTSGVTAPSIIKALGLYKVDGLSDSAYLTIRNYGERLAFRGASRNNRTGASVFYPSLDNPRTNTNTNLGSRPAFVK